MSKRKLGSQQREKIKKLVADRYISVVKHPDAELYIYNYTAKTQYNRYWTEETRMCRGLILDNEGFLIARPFPKFFNLDEHRALFSQNLPKEPFDIYEKIDGSLGILYQYGGKPTIATRGSFVSTQATLANRILNERYSHIIFNPAYTYLFEIVLPENRIVIDYGGMRDLFLLAILDTETGREVSVSQDLGFPQAAKQLGVSDLSELKHLPEKDKEGFVVVFKSGIRLKVKFDEYVRLHKLITGLSPKQIWDFLRQSKRIDELLEKVPDEFYKWVNQVAGDVLQRYKHVELIAMKEFKDLGDRKQTALYFKKCTYPAILFAMLDRKDYAQMIWKLVKPDSSGTFRKDELCM